MLTRRRIDEEEEAARIDPSRLPEPVAGGSIGRGEDSGGLNGSGDIAAEREGA